MNHDIVYILKNGTMTDEIKYSLRSVEKNFPFRSVWFYGGKPKGIEPDHYVAINQAGDTKWQKVNNTLRLICRNDDITEDFWLFNDDFFVMDKVEGLEPVILGTLAYRCQKIKARHKGSDSGYSIQLRKAMATLKDFNLDRLDYAAHYPMLINRAKAIETLNRFTNPMFRSLYGNHHKIGGVVMKDCKIMDKESIPTDDMKFVSTSDNSWTGAVGLYIKERFNERSRFEVL